MGVKVHQDEATSSKMEVGEVDTSAPFQSVKAAVSMFGKSAFTRYVPAKKKPKPQSAESSKRIFANESQLHLAQKELNKYKEQLKICVVTRTTALASLDKEKKLATDLTQKLKTISQHKNNAIKLIEAAKTRSTELEDGSRSRDADDLWKQELDTATEQYVIADAELGTAKKELRRLKKEFESSIEAKNSAIQKEKESKLLLDVNSEQAKVLSKDISSVQESIMHINLATMQAKEDASKIIADKETLPQSYRVKLRETKKKLASLKEFNLENVEDLESKLAETTRHIECLQKELEDARITYLSDITTVKTELDNARKVLEEAVEEEYSIRSLLESLNIDLETVKREYQELKEKEAERESLASNLHSKIQEKNVELEMAISGESKAKAASDDLMSTVKQLLSESESAIKNADTFRIIAEERMEEAKTAQVALHGVEEQLSSASRNLEEARNAEAIAQNQISLLSERKDMAQNSNSEHNANVTISSEEFESLSRRAEESKMLSDIKIAAAVAELEAVKKSEDEAIKKLEVVRKETEETEAAAQETIKSAITADTARMAIEGEVKRLCDLQQKSSAEEASHKPEVETYKKQLSPKTSGRKSDLNVQPEASHKPEVETYKKQLSPKTSGRKSDLNVQTVSKRTGTKKTKIPNLGGIIFRSKRNHHEGGPSSSNPGEKSGTDDNRKKHVNESRRKTSKGTAGSA